ncbi:hypothetical protein B4O97_13405 [Marispirochaeta aestuarii]|uniref:Uncharacterized protein n=1 Tax=Marispirochaeta aestuarii TaxID=1963862 RepID=A0A1Y1RXB2_9SPIO|nr:hypothetical protein [Marispirochaeta aestuarii]ORC34304.1 hypothetical protein B4O97_13405 [Marispirochaeta aestuarii]
MGKISEEAKRRYINKIAEYKAAVETIQKREKELAAVEGDTANLNKLVLADEVLNLVSYYVLMNALSLSLLGVKNEAYLNDARKGCYKAIIYLEDAVSGQIDAPFSDYEEFLQKIESFDEGKRWELIRKLGFSINAVEDGFGANSKWKWSFVEIEGRYATIVKNLLDLKQLTAGLDPRADFYSERSAHLRLTKQLLEQSANRYREKYELSTSRIDDFKLAINYLAALRRIHILLGEVEESEVIRKKMDVWRAKMESDSKRVDQAKRKG